MPKKKFDLDHKTPLEIEWDKGWINMQIHLNNRSIGYIPTKEELEQGQNFKVTDGIILHVQLQKRNLGQGKELFVEINGKPVPGSSGDPVTIVSAFVGTIIFAGLLLLVLYIVSRYYTVMDDIWRQVFEKGLTGIAFLLIFLVGAYFKNRKQRHK